MSIEPSRLVGYLRAEFDKAARLRIFLLIVQFTAVVPAAISVVIPDDAKKTLYVLAILGALFLALWWIIEGRYQRARSAAQAARRAVLLVDGLGQTLSPSETQSLREKFTVSGEVAKSFEKADYYASEMEKGPGRLAEMLEESALYSQKLHATSSRMMLGIIVLFMVISSIVLISAFPFVTRETGFVIIRIFLSALVFVMSVDVIGGYKAHSAADREIGDVRQRLKVADRNDYPLADILMLMSDYNSAIEGAPEILPFAYKFQSSGLDKEWKQYQEDRAAVRAS